MAQPIITDFKDTVFEVSTGFDAAAAITGITNASPPVLTRTAHGLLSGDVVRVAAVGGMIEVNSRMYVVSVLTPDTFALLSEDALGYGVYTTGGTVAKATFSPTCQMTGYTGASGTTAVNTTDTNCGSAKSYGTAQAGQVTLTYAEAPTAFINALRAARAAVAQVALRTTLPKNRGKFVDLGTVISVDANAQANGNWTGGATIERDVERVDVAI